MRRAEFPGLARARLARQVEVGPAGHGVQSAKCRLADIRHALGELDGSVAALEEPQVPVSGHVDQPLHGPAVPLEVHQNRRRHFVPVERFVRRVLEVPPDLSRRHIHGDSRGGIEVVAGALVAHPWPAVAGAPVRQVGLGIVVAGHPHRAATGLPLIAISRPGFASWFSRRRNRVGPPQLLAGVGMVRGDEPANAELSARRSDQHLAIGHERGEAHVVAGAVVGHRGRPHRAPSASVQRHQHGVARGQEHLVAQKGHTAGGRMPVDDRWREGTAVPPQEGARSRLDGDDLAARRRHEDDAVVNGGSRFVSVDRAGRERPHRSQPGDVGRRDLAERTVAPPVVGTAIHQPVAVLRLAQPRLGDRRVVAEHGRHGRRPGWGLRWSQRRRRLLGHERNGHGSEREHDWSEDASSEHEHPFPTRDVSTPGRPDGITPRKQGSGGAPAAPLR